MSSFAFYTEIPAVFIPISAILIPKQCCIFHAPELTCEVCLGINGSREGYRQFRLGGI
jgi:hypothetical protein